MYGKFVRYLEKMNKIIVDGPCDEAHLYVKT